MKDFLIIGYHGDRVSAEQTPFSLDPIAVDTEGYLVCMNEQGILQKEPILLVNYSVPFTRFEQPIHILAKDHHSFAVLGAMEKQFKQQILQYFPELDQVLQDPTRVHCEQQCIFLYCDAEVEKSLFAAITTVASRCIQNTLRSTLSVSSKLFLRLCGQWMLRSFIDPKDLALPIVALRFSGISYQPYITTFQKYLQDLNLQQEVETLFQQYQTSPQSCLQH